jgi:putative ABC transport system ATP-binding protein
VSATVLTVAGGRHVRAARHGTYEPPASQRGPVVEQVPASEQVPGSQRRRPEHAPAVEAKSVYRFSQDGTHVPTLRGVGLTVQSGEFVTVAGPPGSGKSTLLQCLAGLVEPDGGSVRICGKPMSGRPRHEQDQLRASRIGVLDPSPALLAHLTVAQNVDLARTGSGHARSHAGPDPLDQAGIAERRNSLPADLTRAERVRAGLALALSNRPRLILADEPAAELDHRGEQRLLSQLWALAGTGVAVVVATRGGRMVDAADRTLHLMRGEFVEP